MSDKQLGYILMLLTLILTGALTAYFVRISLHPQEARTLRFSEVGSLNVEDPIRMQGIWVGEITGFDHDDSGRVLVYIKSPKPIPIRTSSHIAVKVKGVMGERFIEISPGNPDDPLVGIDEIIDGFFEMGPSEAITHMDLLAEKITELRDIMLWLRDGKDDGKRPFIVAFNDVVGVIDTLVYDLLTGLSGMEDGLNDGLDMAADIAVKTIKFAADAATKAPEILESLGGLVDKIDKLIPKMETAFTQIDTLVVKIGGNKMLWGDHAEKLQKSLVDIKKIIDDIKNDGLPLNVRLRVF
jgi:phospholipid/cholesterol/gamma-HCH transport system substrate-binding protein